MRWTLLSLLTLWTLFLLACSGQLEHELSAFQKQNPPAGPATADAWVAPDPVPDGAPPRMVTSGPMAWDAAPEPVRWDTAPAPATPDAGVPMTSTPPVSACPDGVDALGVLASRCGDCHGAKDRAKNLDLVTTGVAARLVGVKSTCMGKPLLDATAPGTTGHFLDKMRGAVAGCGALMPYAMPALSEKELSCVIEWSERAIARVRGN